MDVEKLIEKAQNTINKLIYGTKFTLKELFEIDEWNRLTKSERQVLGRVFKARVTKGLIPLVAIAKKSYGCTRYIKNKEEA